MVPMGPSRLVKLPEEQVHGEDSSSKGTDANGLKMESRENYDDTRAESAVEACTLDVNSTLGRKHARRERGFAQLLVVGCCF